MKGNINGAQTHVQSKVWKNWNRSLTNLKHSKYQTLITNQLYSYIILFHHVQLIKFLYWENIFFLKCWCSSWLGGREGAYKEMRITAYEHNQLLFFLIRKALHYWWINYFFQFQKNNSEEKNVIRPHLWGQWTTFCGSLGHPAKKLTDLKYSPRNIFYILKQRCQCT